MYILCICVHASAYGVQKRVSEPLEPALQVVKSGSKWEAGTKFWSSARTLEIMLLFYFIEIESHLELAIRPGGPWTNRDLPASSRIRGVCPHNTWHFLNCKGVFLAGSNYPWAKSCQQILRAESRKIDVREPRETSWWADAPNRPWSCRWSLPTASAKPGRLP